MSYIENSRQKRKCLHLNKYIVTLLNNTHKKQHTKECWLSMQFDFATVKIFISQFKPETLKLSYAHKTPSVFHFIQKYIYLS